ncbi:MAG: hypothetical protein E6G59_06210 [Actinobacteria bacterium]|nr:MAG: hypothetical protein E6G59_06210 [Actinomycetota bacterium]
MDLRRIVEEHLPLRAIAKHGFEPAGDRVARRFVAADQEKQGVAEQLVAAQALPVDVTVNKHADQILARARETVVENLVHVAVVVGGCVEHRLRDVLRTVCAGDHVVGPPLQAQAIFLPHTQQVGDHRGRERRGKVANDVAAAGLLDRIDQLRHDRADPVFVCGHAAHREALVDEVAFADVDRVVAVDHRRLRTGERPAPARRRKDLAMTLGPDDVFVEEQRPQAAVWVVVDRLVRAQPRERRVRISRVEVTVEQVWLHVPPRCRRTLPQAPARTPRS